MHCACTMLLLLSLTVSYGIWLMHLMVVNTLDTPYMLINHDVTILYHLQQCRTCTKRYFNARMVRVV